MTDAEIEQIKQQVNGNPIEPIQEQEEILKKDKMVEAHGTEQNMIQSQPNPQVAERYNINADNEYKELKEDILLKLAETKHQEMEERASLPKIRKDKKAKEIIRLANNVIREIKQM